MRFNTKLETNTEYTLLYSVYCHGHTLREIEKGAKANHVFIPIYQKQFSYLIKFKSYDEILTN